MINDSSDLLQQAFTNLQDPQLTSSKKLTDFKNVYDVVALFFSDAANLDPLEYPRIKENYDALKELSDDSSGDIKRFGEDRAKIRTNIQDIKDNITQMYADITDFLDKADERVVKSLDFIKNAEIQAFEDQYADGTITEQERDDGVDDVKNHYDATYYTDYRADIAKDLTDYRQKIYNSMLNPIAQGLTAIDKKTATDADLLAMDEDRINDILKNLYDYNADIDDIRKVVIANMSAHLDAQKELQVVAQPPQVERKQKEPDKPRKNIKKTVKTAGFVPISQISVFTKKYRDSANEFFNKTTAFTTFPKYLFGYITNPPPRKTPQAQTKAEAEIQDKINNIKAQSVKAPWGQYLKMTPAEKEAYFT